jgi:hypothetical protein
MMMKRFFLRKRSQSFKGSWRLGEEVYYDITKSSGMRDAGFMIL